MRYYQLTSEERYALSALRRQGLSQAAVGRVLCRHPSTIGRELKRNSRKDGGYCPFTADEMTRGRRARSRRNQQFTPEQWSLVVECLKELWSPEQISGRLALEGLLFISHETIYRYIWNDRWHGGSLHTYLRHDPKQMRKRYGRYDSRGRLAGKRPISQRPAGAENRSRVGHLEGDTVIGTFDKHCILTLVCRKTGHTMIGKLYGRTTTAVNRRATSLIRNAARRTLSITVDNGTEFHGYKEAREGDRREGVLRDSAPFLGARHEREHQRTDSAVPTEADQHGSCHSAGLHPHRYRVEQQTTEAARLPHPFGGV